MKVKYIKLNQIYIDKFNSIFTFTRILSETDKKNNSSKIDEDSLSIEYVDITRYRTKSQLSGRSKNGFICKYCKRRLANSTDLKSHIINKHPQKH